ncbi:pilus assembly protein CpaE [Paraburkholderia monticola]|uniref:Pilus assembly protein CpaE n=1 Tax=Paraburkholderia monticola TaxID=1399968 RepID=A0A149PB81_9BURK|nr:AAA family ATPase [Paraburkholderia monticola]KXU82273.1 pilus assembly protein CpaE [Paraburkholderia monticola]
MIDIFLIAASIENAQRIVVRLEESGVRYRLHTLYGSVLQLTMHARLVRSADLLIVDDANLHAHGLDGIEETLVGAPALHCMLVTQTPSTALASAARRVGVRHVLSWPLDRQAVADALTQIEVERREPERRGARVVVLASSKGGSGTTLIAVNLACALAAQRERRVLLIDLSQQFADASLLMANRPPPMTLADLCSRNEQLDAALFDACAMHVRANLDLLAGAGDPLKAAELLPEQLDRILTLVRERYDAVLIDVGPSLNPLTIRALAHSDAICMVVRQNPLYLHGARRMLEIFRELGHPLSKVRVVVNQYDKNAQINLPMLERTLGAKVAHQLPRDDLRVNEALSRGVPLVTSARDSGLAQGIGLLANMLWPVSAERRRSMLGRLLATWPKRPPQLKPGV